jgi:hypothetical protein
MPWIPIIFFWFVNQRFFGVKADFFILSKILRFIQKLNKSQKIKYFLEIMKKFLSLAKQN